MNIPSVLNTTAQQNTSRTSHLSNLSQTSADFAEQLAAAQARPRSVSGGDTFTAETASTSNSASAFQKRATLTEQAKKAMASAPAGSIQVFIPQENTVCSSGRGNQYVYAEYTEDSTPEDPIVRIYCRADSGNYEFTRHIKDIDPSHATYAELAALHGHQEKIGASQKTTGLSALPLGYEMGSFMQKQDFLSGLRNFSMSEMFSPNILQDAKDLLNFYTGILDSKKQNVGESVAYRALLDVLDRR